MILYHTFNLRKFIPHVQIRILNKITTIMEIEEPLKYKELFDELLLNEELIFE